MNTLFVIAVGALISITFLAAKAAGLAFRGGGGGRTDECFGVPCKTGMFILGGETSWQGFMACSLSAAIGSIVTSSGSESI